MLQTFDISTNPQTVLLIDDNLDTLELGRAVLEMDGFQVRTADRGTQALAMLTDHALPDLVLLDMQMADMDGPAFLKLLELKLPRVLANVPVVFYTGMDEVPQSKASGFIRKDGDIEQFLSSVHGFIKGPRTVIAAAQ